MSKLICNRFTIEVNVLNQREEVWVKRQFGGVFIVFGSVPLPSRTHKEIYEATLHLLLKLIDLNLIYITLYLLI